MALLQQAVARHGAGALEEADALYRQVLQRDPDNADGLSLRSVLLLTRGALEEAQAHAAAAVARDPGQAIFHSRLGSVLMARERQAEAIDSFSRAVALDPRRAEAHNNLGLLYRQAGDPDAAEAAFRAAIGIEPRSAEAHCNLGGLLQERGLLEAARMMLAEALRLQPDYAEAHLNMANTLRLLDRPAPAEQHLRRALAAKPDLPDAHNSLGLLLRQRGAVHEARAAFEAALSLRPDYAEARANLDLQNHELGLPSHARAELDRFDRDGLAAAGNRMVALLHDGAISAEELVAAHRAFGARIEAAIAPLSGVAATPTAGRRVRIGMLSGGMRRDPAFYFTEPVLLGLDRERFEVHAYAHQARTDEHSAVLARQVERMHDITRLDDDTAARLIRDDGIDLLIAATGYFEGGRVGVIARAPAPRIVNYHSYPATMGLGRVGWRLTDFWSDPPGGAEDDYVERLVRVEGGHLCYAPPEGAPAVVPPPCLQRDHVTFASFNRLSKLNDAVLDVWARILAAIPDARLFLRTAQFADAAARQRIAEAFASRGIAPERLDLEAYSSDVAVHLAEYGRADIALDPYPYNGQTTTCEALWMGVPVIALAGDRYVARVSGALLQRIGHPELVAADTDDYCAVAVGLARDRARLQALRASLRHAMTASTLANPEAFAPRFAAALEVILAEGSGSVKSGR